MSEQAKEPKAAMDNEEAVRLSHRNATNEAQQDLQHRILIETNKRVHVGEAEDEQCRKMADELLEYEPGEGDTRLNDWQVAFLDDVVGYELLYSPKQADKIKEIWGIIYG